MRVIRFAFVIVLTVFVTSGCSFTPSNNKETADPPDTTDSLKVLTLNDATDLVRPALSTGTLKAEITGTTICHWIDSTASSSDDSRIFVVWPFGTTTNVAGDALYDATGTLQARIGDEVSLAGAMTDKNSEPYESIIKDCEPVAGNAFWKAVANWD